MNTNTHEFVTIRVYSWLLLLFLLPIQTFAEGNTVRIVAPAEASRWLDLPRVAVVTDRDDTGQRWKCSGEMPVAMTVARRDFEISLGRQGWKHLHTTPTGVPGQRAELSTWVKGERKLLLLLSEGDAGRSLFSIGET